MRVRFDELFSVSQGMVEPKKGVSINGVTMFPGVSFGISGIGFGGVEFSQLIGKDLDIEVINGISNIIGFFKY